MSLGTTVQQAARDFYRAEVSFIPIREDASKAPDVPAWKPYTQRRPDQATHRAWNWERRTGLAVICGKVSDNGQGALECLDFDERATYDAFKTLAHEAELGPLVERIEAGYCEDTPAGGVHWLYRCSQVSGSLKLAKRPKRPEEQKDPGDTIKTLIETKGEGGYVIVAPSNGRVHETGRAYLLRCGSRTSIATITPQERAELLQLARAFDETPPKPLPAIAAPRPAPDGGLRPGDDFNARTTWPDLLEPRGWRRIGQRGDVTLWRRPGKSEGLSATTNHAGSDLLWVFSTSTPFDAERSYDRFAVYAVLEHGGDYRAAARALGEKGYGTQRPADRAGAPATARSPQPPPVAPVSVPAPSSALQTPGEAFWEDGPAFLERARHAPAPRMLVEGLVPGDGLTLMHAHPRSLKSWLALETVIGFTTGRPVCGRCQVPTPGRALYITNEDNARRVGERLDLLLRGHGLTDAPPDLLFAVHKGVWLDDLTWQVSVQHAITSQRIHLLVLDPLRSLSGAVDQGPRELQPLATWLRSLQRDTGVAVLLLHHDTKPLPGKSDDRRRPHRASGGGLFSIADAPIHLERVGEESRVIVTPTAWKFASDPPPLEVRLEVSDGAATLTAVETTGEDAATITLHEKVIEYLRSNPASPTSGVARGIHGNRQATTQALETLREADRVTVTPKGNAKLWSLSTPTVPLFQNSPEQQNRLALMDCSTVPAPIGGGTENRTVLGNSEDEPAASDGRPVERGRHA